MKIMSYSTQKTLIGFCLGCLILLGGAVHGQEFDLTGIGLSGSRTGLDIEVRPTDSVYVIISFEGDSLLNVTGLCLDEENLNLTGLYFYRTDFPNADSSAGQTTLEIDTTDVVVDTLSIPHTLTFGFRLPALSENIRSLQMRTGIYAINQADEVVTSDTWVSYTDQGEFTALQNPVETTYSTFLFVSHEADSRPFMYYPSDGDTIGRFVVIDYTQPLDAIPGTVTLQFAKTFELLPTIYHTLYLSNWEAEDHLQLELDLLNLHMLSGVDSLQGFSQLYHDSLYQIRMGYQLPDGRLSDSLLIYVRTDLRVNEAVFLSPDRGVSSVHPDLPVLYRLNEPADSIRLIFTTDTLSTVEDLLSPHILTLTSEANSPGLHEFVLDGTQIGREHHLIANNNHGPQDSLKVRAIYNVTLEYGDRFENLRSTKTNNGYIWPEDNQTIPPTIRYPENESADNRSLWVEFSLPEQPLLGSVQMAFFAESGDVGSPHIVYLENHESQGPVSFQLNALALDNSGPPVTRIEGGNSLVDGVRYALVVTYQDERGNPESWQASFFRFDDSTKPPVVYNPDPGETLALTGVNVTFEQPEDAIPGTLKITLTQTGGEEVDPLSPHILYLSDPAAATIENIKRVTIQPAFLTIGEGIDSVRNGGSLTARATYTMTIGYQDTLSNATGSTDIGDLFFPSGSTVTVRGYKYQLLLIPGNTNQEAFVMSAKAEGESALRGIEFDVEGTAIASDVDASQVYLWSSVDTVYSPASDLPIDTLEYWDGSTIIFDSLSIPLSELEQHFIVTVSFAENANSEHSIDLILQGASSVDAGGDPVECLNCPVGLSDIALPVELIRFFTEQHTQFGSLKLIWDVATELNNEGFNIWRRTAAQTSFSKRASFTDYPELSGRGTTAAGYRYIFVDRDLTPGETYYYQLESVSVFGFETAFYDSIASGIPQLPPDRFTLKNAYPNPFNPSTTIEYIVPYVAEVRIRVFDLLGREVRELVRAQLSPGIYSTAWDGRDNAGLEVPTGVYFYQMEGGGVFNEIRKVLLIR